MSFLIRSQILRLINVSKTMHSEKAIYQFANVGCYTVFYSSIFIKNVTWTLFLYCLEVYKGDFNGKEMAFISHTRYSCSIFVYLRISFFFLLWTRVLSNRSKCLTKADKWTTVLCGAGKNGQSVWGSRISSIWDMISFA